MKNFASIIGHHRSINEAAIRRLEQIELRKSEQSENYRDGKFPTPSVSLEKISGTGKAPAEPTEHATNEAEDVVSPSSDLSLCTGNQSVQTGIVEAAAAQTEALISGQIAPWFRDRYKSGLPKPTLANAVTAIKALGVDVRFDLFHHRTTVSYKGKISTIREGLLTDHTVSAVRSLVNNTYGIDCGEEKTRAAIHEIAWSNAYDPVLDFLNDWQGKWDGMKRLDSWVVYYLGCDDTPLNRAIGRKTLIAACHRARNPGCKYDCITVLEGVEGINKSTAIRILAGDENFSDQSIIGASDKEVQEQLDGIWMHENADLAGMRRAEVEHVKAFASRQVDRARPAYGHYREDRPRRSIEWGTTNNDEYLLSQTGNRRIWPLKTGRIDIDALKRDREQLLGEAAAYEAAGESITLDPALWGDASQAQEERRVRDPWEDILAHMPGNIVHRAGDGYERVASADVLLHALGIPAAQQNSGHGQRLAHTMARIGWERNKSGLVAIKGRSVRGYIRPDNSPPAGSSSNAQTNVSQPGNVGAQAAEGGETSLPNIGDGSPIEGSQTASLEQDDLRTTDETP